MQLKIFDVRHGFCAALIDKNYLALIDCGHDLSDEFRPLQWLYDRGHRHINSLVISNFDQDHISDIRAIKDSFSVGTLAINPSISPSSLRNIKSQSGTISNQMEILLHSMNNTKLGDVYSVPYQSNNIDFNFNWINYPHETDTNNISLVSFINFGTSNVVYPGDIEQKGWRRLLRDQSFVDKLKKVNVFIASHHGRSNGYCEEVFNYCKPEVVIISDQARTYSTQEHDLYSKHTVGINMGTLLSPDIRKVITTRNDGHITLKNLSGRTYVSFGL